MLLVRAIINLILQNLMGKTAIYYLIHIYWDANLLDFLG